MVSVLVAYIFLLLPLRVFHKSQLDCNADMSPLKIEFIGFCNSCNWIYLEHKSLVWMLTASCNFYYFFAIYLCFCFNFSLSFSSIWTVDLAYLLQKFSVIFSFFTVTIGANPNFSVESFYKVASSTKLNIPFLSFFYIVNLLTSCLFELDAIVR